MTESSDYVLGRTHREYERLRNQALALEPASRRILDQLALRPGMSCLDVGCGPGEVMRIMGEIVGLAGSVTGIDTDARLRRQALRVLKETGSSQYSFLEGDAESLSAVPGAPFDLTFGRLVLFHVKDPIAVLRKMYKWTRPGGYVVVQDFDIRTVDVFPRFPAWCEIDRIIKGVLRASGRDIAVGMKLPWAFVQAGIGPPDGTDTHCLSGSLADAAPNLEGVYRSLLPKALELGITTASESEACLGQFKRAAESPQYRATLSPLLVGAWKRKHQE